MEQLSAVDAMFVYNETLQTPMHIGQLLIYDPSTAPNGKVRFKEILSYVEGRLDGSSLFRRKLVRVPLELDYPYWVEDGSFDLEYHVRHIALPKPGDWRQLCIQAARIYSRPLDMGRPLWEFTVIEGLDNVGGVPAGSFAILQKYHHSAVDGKAGLEMSDALHDRDARLQPREFDRVWKAEPQPEPLRLLARAQVNNIMNPVRGLGNLKKLLPLPKNLIDARRNFSRPDAAKAGVPRTPFNKPLGPHRVYEGCEFAMSDVKKIRQNFPGATVNDVMVAIAAGSMRSYLKARTEFPEKPLRFGVPVSVRSGSGSENTGNEVVVMTVSAGTHLANAGERLQFIMEETKRSKAITQAIDAQTLMQLSGAMPAGLAAMGARIMLRMSLVDRVSPVFNSVVTNVPGPREPLYFAGAKMVKLWGTGILAEGQGLFHCVTSYCDAIYLTILADRDTMPDPEKYADCMRESFRSLLKAKPR
ncbi:MAG: wax ester/triacylglycerol synthase family O-acyltransferase [Pseudomonadota bacterium]